MKNKAKREKTRELCFSGVLGALALALSFIESTLPALPFLPVGVKIGLSNIVVMLALFLLGNKQGLAIAVLKSLFVLFLRGPVAFAMSFCGSLVSVFAMVMLSKIKGLSSVFISIGGGAFHNLGQLAAASLILKNHFVWYYLPVLLIGGIIMGLVTGTAYRIILPYFIRLEKHF